MKKKKQNILARIYTKQNMYMMIAEKENKSGEPTDLKIERRIHENNIKSKCSNNRVVVFSNAAKG